jgi:hypothetical protein
VKAGVFIQILISLIHIIITPTIMQVMQVYGIEVALRVIHVFLFTACHLKNNRLYSLCFYLSVMGDPAMVIVLHIASYEQREPRCCMFVLFDFVRILFPIFLVSLEDIIRSFISIRSCIEAKLADSVELATRV